MNDETGAFGAESPAVEYSGHSIVTDGEPLDRRLAVDSPQTWVKKRRIDFLDDLIRTLDLLIYAHIATVYYME